MLEAVKTGVVGAMIEPDLALIIQRIEGYAADVSRARTNAAIIANKLYGSQPDEPGGLAEASRDGSGAMFAIHRALDDLRYQINGLLAEQERLHNLA